MKAEFQEFKIEMGNEFKEFAVNITETILEGMDRGFEKLNARMDNLDARLVPIESNIVAINNTLDEIQLELAGALKATDQHAIKLIRHDKRIGRLEKRMA